MNRNKEFLSWKTDINVLIIFFVRDDVLAKTFESVRQARPRRLLLWQDGARQGRPDDVEGIERCRKIFDNIDWDCEVYKNYQTHNWGCDPSTFYSHKWAFSIVDKCIILEDDCVPSQSFYPFCKELLERYEKDNRVNRICGMCNIANYQSPYDYLFSKSGSGPGFATWKRVADLWDEEYSFLDNSYVMEKFIATGQSKDDSYVQLCKSHRASGKPHWETIWSFASVLNNQLIIIPTKNLIQNIGIGTVNSTHSDTTLDKILPSLRQITYQSSYEIEFPLKHPDYVFEDMDYQRIRLHIQGKDTNINHIFVKMKSLLWRLTHGDFNLLIRKLFHLYVY